MERLRARQPHPMHDIDFIFAICHNIHDLALKQAIAAGNGGQEWTLFTEFRAFSLRGHKPLQRAPATASKGKAQEPRSAAQAEARAVASSTAASNGGGRTRR
jgi:hypothetical protein